MGVGVFGPPKPFNFASRGARRQFEKMLGVAHEPRVTYAAQQREHCPLCIPSSNCRDIGQKGHAQGDIFQVKKSRGVTAA